MEKMLKNRKMKINNYSANEKRKFPFVYLILAFPTIQIAVFFFFVNFSAITMAFQDEYGQWGMQSFARVFEAFKNGVI